MMDYAGKIAKAKKYAQEPERFRLTQFTVTFSGDNNPHVIRFENATFHCDCEFFLMHRWCSHSRALEMIMGRMLPEITPA
jgi:hypothetical protein